MVEAARGKCILVTGANVGIGFDCARQLGLMDSVGKVIITCRSAEKGAASKQRLEQLTKRDIFEVVTMDLSDLSTVEAALAVLRKEPAIDGAVLNAGGAGGAEPKALTADGVTNSVAVNVLGHVLLVDRLIKARVLGPGASVVFSGSESARGLRAGPPPAWSPKPVLKTGSIEEFKSICDGTFFPEEVTPANLQHMSKLLGAHAKLLGTFWMGSMARLHPEMRFVTISPGGTSGTEVRRDLPRSKQRFVACLLRLLTCFTVVHSVDVGARRYIDALFDTDAYLSGVFYGNRKGLTGAVVDQVVFFPDFAREELQDNASVAVNSFLPS